MLVCLLLVPGFVSGCATSHEGARRFEFTRAAMGVQARVVLYASSETAAIDAAGAVEARIEELEQALSDWRATSEVNALCARAGDGPVRVSRDLYDAVATSLSFARASDGAFDPTISPLVRVWREARALGRLPDPMELERAHALVAWRDVRLDARARTVELARPGMRLDFGAIGKGIACDEALRVLQRRGIESALIELGGDLRLGAPPPGKSGWSIELEADLQAASTQAVRRTLSDCAVAASGDTQQALVADGLHHSHVIDPRSGRALASRVRVTVVAPDATSADAWATAFSILGEARGRELARGSTSVHVSFAHARDDAAPTSAPALDAAIDRGDEGSNRATETSDRRSRDDAFERRQGSVSIGATRPAMRGVTRSPDVASFYRPSARTTRRNSRSKSRASLESGRTRAPIEGMQARPFLSQETAASNARGARPRAPSSVMWRR